VALTDAQQRTESLRESSPAKYNLPFLSLAQCLPLEPGLVRATRSVPHVTDARTIG
jgi:hypothetical protein